MSTIKDAIDGVKKVNSAPGALEAMALELRYDDRRLIRVETMIELSTATKALPSDNSSYVIHAD